MTAYVVRVTLSSLKGAQEKPHGELREVGVNYA